MSRVGGGDAGGHGHDGAAKSDGSRQPLQQGALNFRAPSVLLYNPGTPPSPPLASLYGRPASPATCKPFASPVSGFSNAGHTIRFGIRECLLSHTSPPAFPVLKLKGLCLEGVLQLGVLGAPPGLPWPGPEDGGFLLSQSMLGISPPPAAQQSDRAGRGPPPASDDA